MRRNDYIDRLIAELEAKTEFYNRAVEEDKWYTQQEIFTGISKIECKYKAHSALAYNYYQYLIPGYNDSAHCAALERFREAFQKYHNRRYQ